MTQPPSPSSGRRPPDELPREPLVLLVGPLPEAEQLRRALGARGLGTRPVAPSDLLAVPVDLPPELGAASAGPPVPTSPGADWAAVTGTRPLRVVSAVIELELAGAAAIVDKVRALIASRELGPADAPFRGRMGARAAVPIVGVGSPARAHEVGLLPTDAVFGRPMPIDGVAQFLADIAAQAGPRLPEAAPAERPRAPVEPAAHGAAGAPPVAGGDAQRAAGAAVAGPSTPVPASRSVRPGASRPPGRRLTYRPAAPPSSSRRDDELLQMAEAEDDAVLEDLSADQRGPSGAPIRLGTDIEQLLDDATRRAASLTSRADTTGTSPGKGRRIGDDLLRELDELLRVEDPSAVERKVVGAGSARPAAADIDRLTSLTSGGSEPPRSSAPHSAPAEPSSSIARLLQQQAEPNGPGALGLEDGGPAPIEPKAAVDMSPRGPAPEQGPAPPSPPRTEAATDASRAVLARQDAAAPGTAPTIQTPEPTFTLDPRTRQQPSLAPFSATGEPGDDLAPQSAQGPPDPAELLRRSTAPPLGIATGAPPAARSTTNRAPPVARRSDSSVPRFPEPPPSEPRTFARDRWAELVPASEPGTGSRIAGSERARSVGLPPNLELASPGLEAAPPATGSAAARSEQLFEDPLSALGHAIARRASGVLVCEAQANAPHERQATQAPRPPREPPAACRSVVLRDGDVITAASDLDGESLLDFLVERGELSPETVHARELRLPRSGRHAVAALIAYGFLGQEELWSVLRAHAEWIVARMLRATGAHCRLEPDVPERLRGEPAVFGGAAGVEVFLEAVRRVVSPATATQRLGGGQARFFVGTEAPLLAEAALPPLVVDAVHAARGTALADLVTRFGESFAPVVLGLLALGVLQAEPRRAERPPAIAAHDELDPLDAVAVRERVRARLALVREGDYFALLGVSPDATEHEIRRAFVELRRRFEPAKLLTAATADLHDDVTLIVELIEEAYDVLRDPWRRSRYRKALSETASR